MKAGAPAVRTLIVDDEPLARRRLRAMLSGDPELDIVGEAANGTAAVAAIAEKKPDLLLLDIQMPGKDGFEVLRETSHLHQPVVVFITAHDEHAIRAFDVQAVDYVLKPVIEDRLRAAVCRAVSRVREHGRDHLAETMARLLEQVRHPAAGDTRIAVKSERGMSLLPVAEIHWIEADGDLVKLHAARATHVLRTTMAEIESRLPADQFVRIHRSAIVRIDGIHEIQPMFKGDYTLVLKNGTKLRSGRAHRAAIQGLLKGK